MLYSFDDPETQENDAGTNVDISETRIARSVKPIHYGVTANQSMTFSLTFGAEKSLSKYETDLISNWLTGHQDYKWLEILQDDLVNVRYKCLINNLTEISIKGRPTAFSCDVVCDSQFAYEFPTTFSYKVDGGLKSRLFNRSTHNGYIYPTIKLTGISGSSISIINHSNGDREFKIENPPNGVDIYIDCERQIISTNELELGKDSETNIYKLCNYKFPRLIQGTNELEFSGNFTADITCEFLRKVGS
jgi:phage-related protein